LDDQVALGFCRRKQIDVLFCRSDIRVARWQSGNLFRQLACRPLKVDSHGAVPFLLGGGPTTTWTRGQLVHRGVVYVTWKIEADNMLLRWEERKGPGIEKMPTSECSSAAPSSVSLAVSSPTSGKPDLPLFRYRWNVSQAEKLLLRHPKIVDKHRPWARRSLGRVALLNQVSVLIVEDEPFIALDLAMAVEEARGKVIGPAGSVCEALMLIEQRKQPSLT
jgi:hypothetical protein